MSKLTRGLPAFVLTTIRIFLLEFFLLFVFRIIFYWTGPHSEGAARYAGTVFSRALLFDMSAAAYAVMPAALFLFVHEWTGNRSRFFYQLSFFLTVVVYLIYALISVADFPYYNQFGMHITRQALLWADSPAFVIRMILGTPAYYLYLLLFILLCLAEWKVLRKIFRMGEQHRLNNKQKTVRLSLLFLLLVLFIVGGARGRLSPKSTLHEGLAIVGNDVFMNQVALNPNYTFFKSVLSSRAGAYFQPPDLDSSIAFTRRYLGLRGPYKRSLLRRQTAEAAFKPLNVVVVCMESMSTYKTGAHGMPELTPEFNKIIRSSLYFDNFYSSGIHTFNGLFSSCAGFPCTLRDHMLRRFTKKPFVTLGNLLAAKGYHTTFYSTHDPHFDNMAGFFQLNGYQEVYSSDDLPSEKNISATGVPDHEIFRLFLDHSATYKKGEHFLAFIMTGSDHGPWAIPEGIPFVASAGSVKERGTQYADWALGYLMKESAKQAWFDQTLFVFVGDHGYHVDGTYDMALSYQQVPFVMHMPAGLGAETIHAPAYQPDILCTVAGFLNLDFEHESFGVDLLRNQHPYVFFTADDKRGVITNDGYYCFDLLDQQTRRLHLFEKNDPADYSAHKKQLADSLCDGARKLYDAAEYFLRTDYYKD